MTDATLHPLVRLLLAAALASGFVATAGDLEPPVPPGDPTMKPLTELEPRRAIYTPMLPLTITEEGSSWYLAEHINTAGNGITVSANNVTIDLNGYQLRGGTGPGIAAATFLEEGTVVRNGSVSWWSGMGLKLGPRAVVENVVVRQNDGNGISVQYDSRVVDCTVSDNGGHGVVVLRGSLVESTVASNNDENGIWAEYTGSGAGALITGCVADGNGKNGIRVDGYATVVDNDLRINGTSEAKAGIWVVGDSNRIENNHVMATPIGIDLDSSLNVLARNTLVDNTTNLDIDPAATGNLVPTFVVGSPGDPAAWDNVCVGTCP